MGDVHEMEDPADKVAVAVVGSWLDTLSSGALMSLSHNDANTLRLIVASALKKTKDPDLTLQEWPILNAESL